MEQIEQWKREAEDRMQRREKCLFQREYINRLEERSKFQDEIISSLERVIKLVIQRNGTKENNNAV